MKGGLVKTMHNPWEGVPERGPFWAPGDEIAIQRWNQQMRERQRVRAQIHKELPAEPYLGNPKAPVVLLNSNPGYDPDAQSLQEPDYRVMSFDNLHHVPLPYPLLWLDPVTNGMMKTATGLESSEYRWWYNRLVRPILEPGHVAESTLRAQTVLRAVAQNVFVINSCAYHAEALLRGDALGMPSQTYSEHLAHKSASRGALMVLLRFSEYWLSTLERCEAAGKPRIIILKDPDSAVISEANWPDNPPPGTSFDDYLALLGITQGVLKENPWPPMDDVALRALLESPFGTFGRHTRQFLGRRPEYHAVFHEILETQGWIFRHDTYRDFEHTNRNLECIRGASSPSGQLWWTALFHAVCDVYGGTPIEWYHKFAQVIKPR